MIYCVLLVWGLVLLKVQGALSTFASVKPADAIIVQFLPELSVDRFLTIYPSLKFKMEGDVTIGSFKAIYGKFDSRFIQLLSYSNLVEYTTKNRRQNRFK